MERSQRALNQEKSTENITMEVNHGGLLRDKDVPDEFRTVFIHTGYRKPGLSAKDCLMSVFQPTNETVNFWSHLIAFFLFVLRFYDVFQHTSLTDPWAYPLTTFAIGIVSLMAMSSIAHLFNSISPSFHHIGFYLDYAAICVYSFSGSQAFFFYSRSPNAELFLFKSPNVFMFLSAAMSMIGTFICCLFRNPRWRKKGHIMRTTFFILYFVIVTFPFTYRILEGNEREADTASVHYFMRHIVTYVISAVVNMFKIPERHFPGVFDFFGQSHHFLHLFAALGAADAFTAVHLDMNNRQAILSDLPPPQFDNTCFAFLLVVVINLSIVYWFAKSLLKEEKRKTT